MSTQRPNGDQERWASEGGATPRGPATHVPAAEQPEERPDLEPTTGSNARGGPRVGHVTKASDAPARTSDAPGQQGDADGPPEIEESR